MLHLLKGDYLKRCKDLAWLFFKYGREDVIRFRASGDLSSGAAHTNGSSKAQQLPSDLERLGPAENEGDDIARQAV
jgi:hypothetical protein